jgi:septal ring factor EnvC (AmiA/AmiB activator)
MRCRLLYVLLLLIISAGYVLAQKSRKELEKEKLRNKKKLEETNAILEQTREKQQITVGQLNALKEKIVLQENKVSTIRQELKLVEQDIQENTGIVDALANDLGTLKKEYANMVATSYKVQNSQNYLLFLFSSESFYQLSRRLQYYKLYSKARTTQIIEIEKLNQVLLEERRGLEKIRLEKKRLLQSEYIETTNLQGLRKESDAMVKELSKKEKQLQDEIKALKKANEALEKLIADVIRAEIRKSTSVRNADKISLTPEAGLVSKSFAGNKSRLNWPVESGFISAKFGKQPHPVLRNVTVDNLGVKIQTNKGASVHAVFEGVVGTVASIQGSNLVTIQHGDFFTVYSNLRAVSVKPGQKVKLKEAIGEVAEADGIAELQFQIWNNMDRLDPQMWLLAK